VAASSLAIGGHLLVGLVSGGLKVGARCS